MNLKQIFDCSRFASIRDEKETVRKRNGEKRKKENILTARDSSEGNYGNVLRAKKTAIDTHWTIIVVNDTRY